MASISIAVVLVILISVFAIRSNDEKKRGKLAGLAALTAYVGVIVGLLVPVSGYTEWELKESIRLNQFIGGTYVEVNETSFSYRYEEEDGTPVSSLHFRDHTQDMMLIEEKEVAKPSVYVFERSGNKTPWTCAFLTKQKLYVFVVPEK